MRLMFLSLLVFFIASPAQAQLSADDFLPPVQASTPAERQQLMAVQGEVSSGTSEATGAPVVQAETAQSAINHVVSQRNIGTQEIQFGSGFGYVATGMGTYQVMENPTATRQSKRAAYVKAFLSAKSSLAQTLNGMSSAGKTQLVERMETITDAQADMTSYGSSLNERIEQSVQMLLKGFMTYSVEDVQDEQTVYVSIVTSPKTLGKFNRPAHNMIQAESVRDGLAQVFAEIQNNLIPPVGGKMIAVGATGEMAFVGFGSAIVATSSNKALQAQQRLSAKRIADMRAADALVGLLIGDDSSWKSKLELSQATMIDEFERSDTPDQQSVQRLQQARESFLSSRLEAQELQSIRTGILPPGIQRKAFSSEDGAEEFAVAVYIPSVSARAGQMATDMQDAQLLQQPQSPSEQQQGGAVFQQPGNVQIPSPTVGPGPSGQVSQDKDL